MMKNTATPSERACLNNASVCEIAGLPARRSHATQPQGPLGNVRHGPSKTRPKSFATMTSQFDKAVSSISSTKAGRVTCG